MAYYKISKSQGRSEINSLLEFKKAGAPLRSNFSDFNLKVLVSQNNMCLSKSIPIKLNKKLYSVIIQLNKPVYKPEDLVQFKVVAIDADTKPIKMNSIEVIVEDSKGNLIHNFNTFNEDQLEFKEVGFFEDYFTLGEVLPGKYKISAKINNSPNIYTENFFTVTEQRKPFFEVKIEAPDFVFYDEKELEVSIFGRYKFGEYVKGVASISVKNYTNPADSNEIYKEQFQIGPSKVIKRISFEEDLKLNLLPNGYFDIKIDVDILDDASKVLSTSSKNVRIMQKKEPSIHILKPYSHTPGVIYKFDVIIKEWNGRLITASLSPVVVNYQLLDKDEQVLGLGEKHDLINDGVASFEVETTKNITKINLDVKYLNAKTTDVVIEDQEVAEQLRVFVDSK